MTSDWRAAFGVHILTASGAAFAMLALFAAVDKAWPAMFAWLGLALVVDGIDGPLARLFGVAKLLPRWSGDTLDLVVDFLTYVFVPAFAIANSGLMPHVLAVPAAIAIVISGAIYFADREMKMDGNYFRGFPGLWNVVAFYLLLLTPPTWLVLGAIAALVALSFAKFPFVHPLRVAEGRNINIGVLVLWAALALYAVATDMVPGMFVTVILCLIAIYVVLSGIVRQRMATTND